MWEIYDEYCRDFERQRANEGAKAKTGSSGGGGAKKAAAAAGRHAPPCLVACMHAVQGGMVSLPATAA